MTSLFLLPKACHPSKKTMLKNGSYNSCTSACKKGYEGKS
jgi:hypothetical protein